MQIFVCFVRKYFDRWPAGGMHQPVLRSPIRLRNPLLVGPRRQGEGIEEDEQGIVSAVVGSDGSIKVRVTLLAAGFLIGMFIWVWRRTQGREGRMRVRLPCT